MAEGQINRKVLDEIVEEAERSRSGSLLIQHDGHVVVESYFAKGKRDYPLRSITKSIGALGVMHLLGAGLIGSLDDNVSEYFSEWKNTPKEAITILDVLTHTSGLETIPPREIERVESTVALALDADLIAAPGSTFLYNNLAVHLLSGIAQMVASMPLDQYVAEHIFAPLTIQDARWQRDPSGHTYFMSGLRLDAVALARIGQLLLDEGQWQKKPLLSKEIVKEFTQKVHRFLPKRGLLWWLETNKTEVSITDEVLELNDLPAPAIKALCDASGQTINWNDFQDLIGLEGLDQLRNRLDSQSISGIRLEIGDVEIIVSDGEFGQYLLIDRMNQTVVVRQIDAENHDRKNDRFVQLRALVRRLHSTPNTGMLP